MHNDRFYRPAILAPTWVPSPSQIRRLDQMTSEGVNGDGGGVWNPLKPIIIGGAGVSMLSTGEITGGVSTGKYAPDGALILGDDDWPVHVTPKTRKFMIPLRDVFWAFSDENVELVSAQYDQSVPGKFRATAPTFLLTSTEIWSKYLPLGATIDEVRLRFSVGVKPAAVPASLPSFYLATTGASEQQFLSAPADVDAYYNDGLPQDIVLVPAVITTVTADDFLFQLSDQSDTFNIYHSVSVTLSNIVDMRPGL